MVRPVNILKQPTYTSGVTEEREEQAQQTLFAATAPWMIARGVLGVIFAIVATFAPREELGSVAHLGLRVDFVDYLLMGYIGLNALLLVAQGASTKLLRMHLWGQAVIALPALLFLVFAGTPGQLRAAVLGWALLNAALELWIWKDMRDTPAASDYLYSGIAHGLLGVLLIFGNNFGALTIIGFTSAAVLISSVLYILGGLGRRKLAREN